VITEDGECTTEFRTRLNRGQAIDRRPSPKLTAPETIGRYRDMVSAYQNLNGSRDLIGDGIPSVG